MNYRIPETSLKSVLFKFQLIMLAGGLLAGHAHAQTEENRVMAGVRFDGNTSMVSLVIPGGPADRAGIQVGDEILSADRFFVVQPADLMKALQDKQAGQTSRLEIMRENQVLFFDLKLVDAVKGDVVIGEDGKVVAAPPKLGVLNEIGPELKVRQWSGVQDGDTMKLKDNRGKVVCMLLFQTDCEFSQIRGLPELEAIQEEYGEDPDVFLLAIQTPFRNYDVNTHGAAIKMFRDRGLSVPLGHDGNAQQRTVTYDEYQAYGTPWFIVLDHKGIVHYNDASLPIEEARVMFEMLKEKARKSAEAGQTDVESRPDSAQENAGQPDQAAEESGKQADPQDG